MKLKLTFYVLLLIINPQVHEELDAIGAYSAEARARRILAVS